MQESSNRSWIKYLVAAVIGIVAVLIIGALKGLFRATEAVTIVLILSDAFTLVGILWICFGVLTVLNKAGAFDGLGYSFQSMVRVFRNRMKDDDGKPHSYYDYKKAADAKRKRSWHLIIVGAAFLAVAIVLVIIHSSMT